MFGDAMQLDDAVLGTAVFRHVGQYPAQEISWAAVGVLTAITAALTAVGTVGFRRRDQITA